MVGRSSPLRRDDYGGGRHNTPVRDARPRTREPVSHRTTSNKTPIVVPRRRRRRTVSRASRASEFNTVPIARTARWSRAWIERTEPNDARARRVFFLALANLLARVGVSSPRARERRVTRRVVIVTRGRFVENASSHRHAHQPGSWCGDLRVVDCLPTREWRDESTRARARKQRITQGEGREEK